MSKVQSLVEFDIVQVLEFKNASFLGWQFFEELWIEKHGQSAMGVKKKLANYIRCVAG